MMRVPKKIMWIAVLYVGNAVALQTELNQLTTALQGLSNALTPAVPPSPGPGFQPPAAPGPPAAPAAPPPPPAQPPVTPSPVPTTPPARPTLRPVQTEPTPTPQPEPGMQAELQAAMARRQAGQQLRPRAPRVPEPGAPGVAGQRPSAATPAFRRRPPVRRIIEVSVPTINIPMQRSITVYMQQLRAKPVRTPAQKAEKKAFARGVLNGILTLVQKKQVNKQPVAVAVKNILNADPLLISTAALVLERVGFDQEYIRNLMVQLYRKQVAYIKRRFQDEQALDAITEGARDDIDEAVSYPMELAGALREAENIKLMSERKTDPAYVNATSFLNQIEKLKQELCDAIKANADKFRHFPEYYAVYDLYCGKTAERKVDVYCTTPECTYGPGLSDVSYNEVNLERAITDIQNKINTYNASAVGSEKIMLMQEILGTLSDFSYFFGNPYFCTICLRGALRAVKRTDPLFENALNQITDFINGVAERQQNRYLAQFATTDIPEIKRIIREVNQMSPVEVNRRYSDAKAYWHQFKQ